MSGTLCSDCALVRNRKYGSMGDTLFFAMQFLTTSEMAKNWYLNRSIVSLRLIASWLQVRRVWRAMDTLKDRQVLEDMVERGEIPWLRPQDLRVGATA